MAKCGACGKFVATSEGAKCSKCMVLFDRACVALPATGRIVTTWVCPACTSKVPRDNSSDTPVKGVTSKTCVIEDNPEKASTTSVAAQENLALQMRLLREEIVDFRGELAKVRTSISACEERLSTVEQRLEKIEQKKNDNPHNLELVSTITKLQSELNDREQELLMNDVELSNLPEDKGENPTHLAILVASKLGISLDERDIVSAVRVGPHKSVATEPSEGESEGRKERVRPRALVVRMARRVLRDEFLRSARVRRGATTADMGLRQEPRRFYVNERLTRANRQLFFKTREEGRRLNWRYIWTKDGRIYVRQDHGTQAHRIKTEK